MTLVKQVSLDFSQTIPQVSKRTVRSGAEERYNECLDYLRAELASGTFERISPDDVARVFKVTSSFMFMVACTGAISSKRIKGKGMHYRAEEKLATLTGKDLLNFRLAEFPNPPYGPEPGMADALNSLPKQEQQTPEQQLPMGAKETYLVGKISPDLVLEAGTVASQQYESLERAEAALTPLLHGTPGKIVIAKIVVVYESVSTLTVTLKETTL